jgi:hypothetical protein
MMRFVDYSRSYYEQIEKTAVPRLREGKFVQIAHGEDEYIVFSPKGLCKYHSHIVERFAELQKLSVSTDRAGETVGIDDIGWRIIGGGKMRMDDASKNITLSGSSQVYGAFRREGLQKKLAGLAELDGYSVNLDE